MQHSDPPISNQSRNNWQILGELELTVNSNTELMVSKRLTTILIPLDLPADFLNKVLRSAADCMTHALQTNGEVTLPQFHISIFVSNNLNSDGRNWGFFRIEKTDNMDQNKEHCHHEIEFYLYTEGQEITG